MNICDFDDNPLTDIEKFKKNGNENDLLIDNTVQDIANFYEKYVGDDDDYLKKFNRVIYDLNNIERKEKDMSNLADNILQFNNTTLVTIINNKKIMFYPKYFTLMHFICNTCGEILFFMFSDTKKNIKLGLCYMPECKCVYINKYKIHKYLDPHKVGTIMQI